MDIFNALRLTWSCLLTQQRRLSASWMRSEEMLKTSPVLFRQLLVSILLLLIPSLLDTFKSCWYSNDCQCVQECMCRITSQFCLETVSFCSSHFHKHKYRRSEDKLCPLFAVRRWDVSWTNCVNWGNLKTDSQRTTRDPVRLTAGKLGHFTDFDRNIRSHDDSYRWTCL